MLRSSSLSGRLYTNLEISLPGRELEEYTPVNLSHSLPLTAGHRRTADQPTRTAPQMLPHLQQPSCEIKLLQNYIIGLTYLDRHERLDESLSFISPKWIRRKFKIVRLVASMIVSLLAWSFNSVRQSATNILRIKVESVDGGCGNCVVDGC